MKTVLFKKISIILLAITVNHKILTRDLRRPKYGSPSITVSISDPEHAQTWASNKSSYNKNQTYYRLTSQYLRLRPIKHGFDQNYFNNHLLPKETIEFRNKKGAVSGTTLSNLAQDFLEEIKVGQRKFSQVKILKDTDFNYNTLSGLIIVKFNNYPFVLKLSIEHPHTMVEPCSKGIQAYGIFVVGGNLRHLTNFTRIPNLHRIQTMLSYNPFYLRCLDFPRKWYWQPKKTDYLKVDWECNGNTETLYLPNIYATISDFIETEPIQPQSDLNRLSMKVATDTGFLIDPHSGNIVIEKETHNYVLLDTEDFRMMVGLDRSMKAKKYIGWYIELICNSLKIMLFRTKKERLAQSCSI